MKGTISFFYNNALIPIPTKGTMPGSFKRVFNYKCFNLRTREGYDNIIFASSSYVEHFNTRTREGYDRYRLAGPPQMYSFNPRTHEGYDHDFFTNEKLPFNSCNPRTREGYDTSILLAFFENIILIPVPMKGTILIKLGFPK